MTITITQLNEVMQNLNHNDCNTYILLHCRALYKSVEDNQQLESLLYNLQQLDKRLHSKLIYQIITSKYFIKNENNTEKKNEIHSA